MSPIVRTFNVHPVIKEQVESMGGTFLKVDHKKNGSAADG